MSLFFNFQVDGDRTDETRFEIDELLPSGTVVDDQSGYMIGINRFKLPISNVPMFRIYADEYHFGVGFRGGIAFNNIVGGVAQYKNIAYGTDLLFGGSTFPNSGTYGKYGKDNLFVSAATENRKKYVDINSHEEFTSLLNNAYAKGFSKLASNMGGHKVSTLNVTMTGDVNCDGGAAGDGISTLASGTIAHIAGVNGGFNGSVITRVRLNLTKMTSTDPTKPFDFSNMNFFMETYDDDGAGNLGNFRKRFFFNKNILRGISDFDTATSADLGIDFCLAPNFDIDAQTQLQSDMITAFRASGSNDSFKMYPSATDFAGVYGQRADPIASAAGPIHYVLKVHNTTFVQQGTFNGVEVTIPNGGAELFITHLKLSSIPAAAETQTATTQAVDFLLPQFKYDPSSSKIYLARNNVWDNWFGTVFYMNEALRRLVSFDEYVVHEVETASDQSELIGLGVFETEAKGAIFSMPLLIDKLDHGSEVNGREVDEIDNFYEARVTTFARDWLDSVVITSGSIATQGEIVGNGQNTRNTITDFKLDPSTIARDYLIYQEGNTRYYPLRSTLPLHNVQVSVLLQDIKGILRPLFIPPRQIASLKLEFRPTNMIFNYQV
mgnify:CR=1 FL=1